MKTHVHIAYTHIFPHTHTHTHPHTQVRRIAAEEGREYILQHDDEEEYRAQRLAEGVMSQPHHSRHTMRGSPNATAATSRQRMSVNGSMVDGGFVIGADDAVGTAATTTTTGHTPEHAGIMHDGHGSTSGGFRGRRGGGRGGGKYYQMGIGSYSTQAAATAEAEVQMLLAQDDDSDIEIEIQVDGGDGDGGDANGTRGGQGVGKEEEEEELRWEDVGEASPGAGGGAVMQGMCGLGCEKNIFHCCCHVQSYPFVLFPYIDTCTHSLTHTNSHTPPPPSLPQAPHQQTPINTLITGVCVPASVNATGA